MPLNHSAWVVAKPPVAFPDSPKPYSPIFVPSFDKEEYANYLADGRTEVEDVEAAKEPEAEVDASRSDGDPKDNLSRCKVPYCNVRGMVLVFELHKYFL